MFQKTIAFTVRTFRQETRLFSVGLSRLAILGIAMFFLYMLKTEMHRLDAPGRELIALLSGINLIAIGILGITYFSSVITEEKEEQTIGLLLMTGMTPLSLMLGKSIPRLLNAVLLLTIQFPFTLLGITMGGMTLDQVFSIYMSLLATLLAASQLGLLASVIARTSFGSSLISAAVIGTLVFGQFVFAFFAFAFRRVSPSANILFKELTDFFEFLNPVMQFEYIRRSFVEIRPVGQYFYTYLGMSLGFFLLARVLFPVFIKGDEIEGKTPLRHRVMNFFRRKKKNISLLQRKSIRVKGSAFLWKDFHFQAGGKKSWKRKTLVYSSLILLVFFFFITMSYLHTNKVSNFEFGIVYFVILFGILWVIGLEAVYHVSNIFSQELKENTLGIVYMIPGSMRKKVYLKTAGNLLGLVPVVSMILLTTVLFVGVSFLFDFDFGKTLLNHVLDVEEWIKDLWELFGEPEFQLVIAVVIFSVHFLMTMTLYLKKAAIPVSAIICVVLIPVMLASMEYFYRYYSWMAGVRRGMTSYRHIYEFACTSTAVILLIASALMHFVIIPLRVKSLVSSG